MAIVSRLPGLLNIVLIQGRPYSMLLRFSDSLIGTVTAHYRANYQDAPQSGAPFTVSAGAGNDVILSLSEAQILAMAPNENFWSIPKDFQQCPLNRLHRAGRMGFWSVAVDNRVLIHGAVAVVGVR